MPYGILIHLVSSQLVLVTPSYDVLRGKLSLTNYLLSF